MTPAERELGAAHLRLVAQEIGLDLTEERFNRLLGMLESAVDELKTADELGLDGVMPALVPDLDTEADR